MPNEGHIGWSPYYVLFEQSDLEAEWLQCRDEGKILPRSMRQEFERLRELPLHHRENQAALLKLMDETRHVPVADDDYDFVEPSDLEGIRKERSIDDGSPVLPEFPIADTALLSDKIRGAWYGRSIGCLLGTPVEGWTGERLENMLRDTERFPLTEYMKLEGVSEDIRKRYDFAQGARWVDTVKWMPEDDDMNYTLAGMRILQEHGRDFTPLNVGEFWLRNLPPWRTCTAERLAIRNLMLALEPPETALHRNPYREWIGAQIRADFFGWAAPGNPELAAEFAWRDACISHVKNGIYGEMWVAAMLAAAAVLNEPRRIVRTGMQQIPEWSRLHKHLSRVLVLHKTGATFDDFIAEHRARYDHSILHNWVHTVPNAEIVAAALLWGNGDFTKTVCMSVQAGMDTDCNGATVGSVAGLMLGASHIPEQWIAPLNGKASFGLAGVNEITYDQLVTDSVTLIQNINTQLK